jgi:NitT/TauT family transport system ATP-binding protein
VWWVDLPQPRADLLPEMGALRLEILTRLRTALRAVRGEAALA